MAKDGDLIICGACRAEFEYGATICRGCHGEVVYGANGFAAIGLTILAATITGAVFSENFRSLHITPFAVIGVSIITLSLFMYLGRHRIRTQQRY